MNLYNNMNTYNNMNLEDALLNKYRAHIFNISLKLGIPDFLSII